MSQYNIGPKIGIEGEKEFRAQISRINSEYRSMDSYLKTLDRSMAQNGKSQEALAAKSNILRQQMALQEQRHKELSEALAKASTAYGENSKEALRFQGALLDVDTTMASLSRELSKTEDEMQKLANGIDDVSESADDAEPKVLSFGDMLKAGIASGAILNGLERAGEMIVDIGKQAIEAAADVQAANAQFQQTFGELEGRATSALKSISDETGVAVTRLQGGYTALYAFTKSVGGDQETALNIAQRALTAAADSAAYYDRSMEDATETLQSFLKGNYANDAALGIAATETTRNAKANELYAKSFKDLTEAQKVDTLLAMVEAGNKASGALGQAAREADSWSNVTGELSEAWRQFLAMIGGPILSGVTPIIQGITEGIKKLTTVTPWVDLNRGIDGFREGIAGAGEALAASNAEIDTTAGLAGQYVDRLRELEQAGLTTEEAMREYAATVDLLNQLMPELNLTIDSGTGKLEQNTDQIYRNIQALKDQAREQAQQAYYAAIVEELAAVEKDRYAAEMRLYELQAKANKLISEGADANVLYASAQALASGNAEAFYRNLSEEDRALMQVMEEMSATEKALESYNAEVERHEQKLQEAIDAQERMADSSKDLQTKFQEAFAGMKVSMDAGLSDLLRRARSLGYDTGAGIANGVQDSIPAVESAFTKLAKRGQGAYLHTMDQHSPSRVMRAKGRDSGLGAALGVEDSIPDMERAMTALAEAGQQRYVQQQLDHVAQYPSMMQGVPGYGAVTNNSRSVDLGGVTFNVYTQPGQDGNDLYEQFVARLTREIETGGAAF